MQHSKPKITARWLHAMGIETDEAFLIRTLPPRCIIKVDEAEHAPRVTEAMSDGFETLYFLEWLDGPPPPPAERKAILEEAAAALQMHDVGIDDEEDE